MSWRVKISKIILEEVPDINQAIEISYRQGGTSDEFGGAVNITCSPDGTIVTPSSIITLGDFADEWGSVDVKYKSVCNETELIETYNRN